MKRVLLFLALLLASAPAAAHEVRPAYLEIHQTGAAHYRILWKQPAIGDRALHLVPHLSNGWLERKPASVYANPGFLMESWEVTAVQSELRGQTVRIEGLEQTMTDVLLRVSLLDGTGLTTVIKPDRAQATLDFTRHDGLALPAYLQLGIMHILTGADHLMFVLGLLLLVGVRWRLIKAITAFTVAHSITLGASAIGLVHVPSAVIEALVALSIVFVAYELALTQRHHNGGLTQRLPWLIAFTFGLLHGFAFASALAEVGLPKDAVPLSLFLFNLGVEIGQLMFVAVAIAILLAAQRLAPRLPAVWRGFAAQVPTYTIGIFAAFWFIQRAAVALG